MLLLLSSFYLIGTLRLEVKCILLAECGLRGGTSLPSPDLKKVFVCVQKVPVKELGQGCPGLVASVFSQRVGMTKATLELHCSLALGLWTLGRKADRRDLSYWSNKADSVDLLE